jgi:hypothetical protein
MYYWEFNIFIGRTRGRLRHVAQPSSAAGSSRVSRREGDDSVKRGRRSLILA